MREIKFRAWDDEHRVMVLKIFNGVYETNLDSDGTLVIGAYDSKEDWYELKVLQFTGLKDKNGKEIYEGDILEIGGDKVRKEIYWNNKFAWWDIKRYEHSLGLLLQTRKFVDVEVIGNIYENPDLLGESE